ncbi:predicted protein [Streptomyces filamentosus NRRL 15998]|uniref:Predicted protein n=1 Tax=Streptomyces filamentosus NRRL 15998 TaxID=457431 RepID=D6AR53_STRFL|nr:predicted protein [Streptomyces filamentosus NRRL 15998]
MQHEEGQGARAEDRVPEEGLTRPVPGFILVARRREDEPMEKSSGQQWCGGAVPYGTGCRR